MSSTEIQLDDTNQRHRCLVRLILARRDWDATLASLHYLIEHLIERDNPLFYGLTTAAVVCYARPFLGGRNQARIPSRYEKFPHAHMRISHRNLLLHRNLVIAHAHDEKHKVSLIPKETVFEWNGGKGRGRLTSHGEIVECPTLTAQVIAPINDLVQFQLSRLKEHIQAQKNELFP